MLKTKVIYILFTSILLIACNTIHYPYNQFESKYNGRPKIIEEIRYKKNEIKGGKIDQKIIYHFDKNGNAIKSYCYDELNILTENCVDIPNDRNEIESICYNKDSTLITRSVDKFDEKGKKTSTLSYSNDKISKKREFKYEKNGVDFINYGYDNNNQLEDKTLILHNKKGKMIKSISYAVPSENIENIIEYSYDKNGNEIGSKHYAKGKLRSKRRNTYNKTNNILYQEWYFFTTEGDSILRSKSEGHYKYDGYKNMISELIIVGEDKYLTTKTITYY